MFGKIYTGIIQGIEGLILVGDREGVVIVHREGKRIGIDPADTMVLFRSELRPTGAVYQPLQTFTLGE